MKLWCVFLLFAFQNWVLGAFDESWSVEKPWKEPFFFIQMADCQLGFMNENASWEEEIELLETAVSHINRLQPKFVILCGDIVHAYPKDPLREIQLQDYRRIVDRIDPQIPLICLCGNHDVGNSPDRETIALYEAEFGPHYLTFWIDGVQGIALNSSLIWDPTKALDLYEEQLAWFQEVLQEGRPDHRLVFSHHPWFIHSADEEDWYFVIPQERRAIFLNLMKKAGVAACFCGHYHRNAESDYQGMAVVTTSAVGRQLGDDLSGFRIIRVYKDRIEHEYCSFDSMTITP